MATITTNMAGSRPRRIENVRTVGDVKKLLEVPTYLAKVDGEIQPDSYELLDEQHIVFTTPTKGA